MTKMAKRKPLITEKAANNLFGRGGHLFLAAAAKHCGMP